MPDFTIQGKVAIVTGAGNVNSIGAAYAHGLAEAGASVIVADINQSGAEEVATALRGAGLRAHAVRVDVTDPNSTKHLAGAAMEKFGGIDILVNNAAMMVEITQIPLCDFSLEEWNRIMAVNVTGALLCAQAVVPHMRARGGGKIVNQASGGAFQPSNAYGVSKSALVSLTIALAKELGPSNIAVNAIAPGFTTSSSGQRIAPVGSPFRTRLKQLVAMREAGEPNDLVGPLLLLVSSAGSWITGQTLSVDGGWVMRT